MLPKIICIIVVINLFSTLTEAIHISERNETNLILLMESQLTELRTEQQRQKKDDLEMQTNIQSIRAEQDRQGKLLDGLLKAVDSEDRQEKLINVLAKATDIQLLKSEQERLGKLIDGLLNPRNCTGAKIDGIFDLLLPNFSSQPFKVACDAETLGGGWTIILRRIDGSVDFYRSWTEYKNGFGDLSGEFILGLDKIHAITAERRQELLVVVEDFEGNQRFEMYDDFAIGNEYQQYELHTLGTGRGTAGDSLYWHRGKKFTTFDRDNDSWKEENCAVRHTSAWWYGYCHSSNLAGKYNDSSWGTGVIWNQFRGYEYSLKRAVMMVRPRRDPPIVQFIANY